MEKFNNNVLFASWRPKENNGTILGCARAPETRLHGHPWMFHLKQGKFILPTFLLIGCQSIRWHSLTFMR